MPAPAPAPAAAPVVDYLALTPIADNYAAADKRRHLVPLLEAIQHMRYGRRPSTPPKLRPGLTKVDEQRVLRMLGPDTFGIDTEVSVVESRGFPDRKKKIAYELRVNDHFDRCDECGCACYCARTDNDWQNDGNDDVVDPLKFALLEKVYNRGLGNECGGYMTVVRSGPDLRPSPSRAYDVYDDYRQCSYGVWNGYVQVVLRRRKDGRELDRFLVAVVVTDHDT